MEYKILRNITSNTSAHQPLRLCLSLLETSSQQNDEKQEPRLKLLWNKCEVNCYTDMLQQGLDVSTEDADPSTAIEHLISVIQQATKVAVPVQTVKPRKAPWNPDIAKALKQSKEDHFKWDQAGRPNKGHPMHTARQNAKNLLRRTQRQQAACERHKNLNVLMTAKKDDSRLFYKIINNQRNTRSSNTI